MKKLEVLSKKNTVCKKKFLPAKALWVFALILLAFSSCSKKSGNEIELDNSDPLALAIDIKWAVITVPYATFRKETSWNAQATAYCKKGEVFQILAISEFSLNGKTEIWYHFEDGWLPNSAVSIYQNKLSAENAAKRLK